MSGLPRWKNSNQLGATVFVTSTILDFTPIFQHPGRADLVTAGILQVHRFYSAHLYGFVVMPEHIHFLCTCPPTLSAIQFVDRLKSATANWMLDELPEDLRIRLSQSKGANRSSVWMKGFRSVEVFTKEVLMQKLEYIHNNPVKRGLCLQPDEYRWSSARFYESSLAQEDVSLASLAFALERWPPTILPELRARRR
jgi:putative transposase